MALTKLEKQDERKEKKERKSEERKEKRAEIQFEKKHRKKVKCTFSDVIFNIINYSVFLIFTLTCMFPFYYLFINTISNNKLVSKGAIYLIPRGIHLKNYISMMNVSDFGTAFMVTTARTIVGTIFMVLASAFVGYLVTKNEMWGKSFWYRFMFITMYFNAGLIPTYLNLVMLGLTNTFWVYILPTIVAPYNIILVKTYIESIPAELEESAQIDGAGYFKVFMKIIFPLCKPILATIAIFGAVGHWNSFTDSLIYMQNATHLQTLQHKLYNYLNKATNIKSLMSSGGNLTGAALDNVLNMKTIKYTVAMVSIIPILLVYPFMQRYFEKGIMLGAVKG